MSTRKSRMPWHSFEAHGGNAGRLAISDADSRAYLKDRSRRLLVTAKTDENAIAAPAIIGLSMPGGGQRQGGDVVAESPEEVPIDGGQGLSGQPDRVRRL